MDFLDPKKKRAHKIRLYIGYALMGFALLLGSTILFFEARGFDLNRKTGEIIQNGLIFADTHPESADVYLNGKYEGSTDIRLTVPSGDYTLELKRDGYRSWSRSFTLNGSEIERLNYAFLFPNELQTSEIRTYETTPDFATQSPDRKWVIIQRPGTLRDFDVLDISDQNSPRATSFQLPANVMTSTAGDHKLELVEWSNDNRRFIAKHIHPGGQEFVLIDREAPAESLNLNKHLEIPIYKVALRDKKYDKLHILGANGGTLSFADVKSKQTSDIATNVFNFKSYSDDVLFYVTNTGAKKGTVDAIIRKGDDNFKLRSVKTSKTYPLDITRYDNEWYLGIGSPSEKKAYVYYKVFEDLERKPPRVPFPISVFRMDRIDNISVSANTRFVSVQGGSEFAVYDAEHNRQYQYDTKLKLGNKKVEWMDGHRFAVVLDGKLVVWEYDGINEQTLVSAHPQFIPFFDRDYDFLYTLAPSTQAKGQTQFTKTPMRTPADL